MGFHIVWVGVLMVVATLILYVEFLVPGMSQEELRHPRTIAFFTISLFQLFHVLAIRVWNESVFTAGFFRNRYLLGAVAIALTLQLAVIYLPPLAAAFETVPLALDEVLLCVLVASTLFWAVEAEKALRKRKPSAPVAAPAVPEAVG
jgi:Ca2+-transporting ATPase